MSLITRTGKGSKLTIQEMDGNLIHLNNNPLLLGKITADLTLPVSSKIIAITECMDPIGEPIFIEGETVTFKYGFMNEVYGTASIVGVTIYSENDESCKPGNNIYSLELENLSFALGILPSLIAEGDISGASKGISSLGVVNIGTPQLIELNAYGSLFKINEVLLTGINGTPSVPTNCFINDELDNKIGELISPSEKEGINSLGEGEWIMMVVNPGYSKLVGNSIYFSVDALADSPCSVDVYVFGYTLG